MVDESLIRRLTAILESACSDAKTIEDRLRQLFAYSDSPHQFVEPEVAALINAIDALKILDPACGSGAFPMGILHKLVYVLAKLDPGNQRWKDRQLAKANEIPDSTVREHVVADIEQSFRGNELDYGRKLYLIENCIYGVDIQPIAVQISKLRFFISLVVDQKVNPEADNRGILPLPNLETKFVAANTLIGVERPGQQMLRNLDIKAKEDELREVRKRHFVARTPTTKAKCREQDARLRAEIAEMLKNDGWPSVTAKKLAAWDPYNQNASASFFDTEWMFGMLSGFDLTIGNPPYVRADEQSEWNKELRESILATREYETLWEKWDLFVAFIEKGYKLLKEGGITTMIVSDAYSHSKYAQKSQTWFLQNGRFLRIDFCSNLKIFDAAVHNIIYFFQRLDGLDNVPERRVHHNTFGEITSLPSNEQRKLTFRAFFPEDGVAETFSCKVEQLNRICYISKGMVVHADEDEARGEFELSDLVSDHKDRIHSKPFVEGKHLERWLPAKQMWLEWGTPRAPGLFSRPTFSEIYLAAEKLISVDMLAGVGKLRVAYDDKQLFHNHSAWSFVPWYSLHGVRNNSLKKAARYSGEKPVRADLPKREELEATSRRFSVRYLLGIMNSTHARDFLRANRRSNIHLYPDDWKKLPIPDVPPQLQQPIVDLVQRILDAKRANPRADVTTLEASLDLTVGFLYGIKSSGDVVTSALRADVHRETLVTES
jgi:hypothetical protein